MNKKLAKAEREMFISLYGEEEAAKIDAMPKEQRNQSKNMEYSQRPPSLRAEIDRRNNKKK